MWNQIAEQITQATGKTFTIENRQSVGGGCINQGYRLSQGSRQYFVKLNQAVQISMFEAEALGTQQIGNTQTINVPQPICWGVMENSAYLVMEWLNLAGKTNPQSMVEMGRKLALMHQWIAPESYPGRHQFGWDMDNTIGSTPQPNPWTENWAQFWQEHRIGHQFRLAKQRGENFDRAEELMEKIPELLADHQPQPSLVHGDLWGGNAAISDTGEPIVFDPATYFGDREVDLAMTELFGGFSAAFYQGYKDIWPLESGYECRKTLYNLYHILNHFNLFGGGYGSQANQMIRQLLN
ncbi:MAG: fructosamine kinase family protein [Oscillatoriales cyanobacterium RM1_1_9]|nr:fructosamine kinase family protein [Oscillatoriales cyanobacterium SM2_3_0]NJO47376.1 fructosamine kinase family protein [Oscillatoriales cyanobacterium RM2_1_1]NJO71177.1 fructosamine kinase family protein [Oscillatoriales cyanobacterium RM1_1_9]